MPHKNINISDRVANQLPEFIREEDQQFVDFLFQYYKSQEKTGRPYDILNNLLGYLDLDSYTSDELSNDTLLLSDIGLNDKTIRIEAIDGFKATDGSIKIDNEVIYYETVTRGPDAIVTPGVSPGQFDKKKQQLENPFQLFDGTQNKFALNFLGTPVNPPSVDHLIVIVYNEMLVPGTDYFLEGDEIRFAVAPRERSGADDSAFTQIIYLVGYADQTIVTTDAIPYEEYQSKKEYPLRVNTQPYTPTSAIGLIVKKNNRQLEPYTDYTVYGSEIIFRFPLGAADDIHIRSVEYIAPNFGSGASAVVSVDNLGQVDRLIPKTGGSGYRLEFAPKVVVQHSEGVGATAKSLVSGIKNINLIDGGQGYTSYNPPLALVGAPTGGTLAKVALTVDDTTGQVDSLTIMNSGSGYDFIPAISFANPGGCKIGQPTIDSEGRVNIDSIAVEEFGLNYSNPPIVYLDPAPEGGINAQAISRINQDGQVYEIVITNRGRGYVTPPRARIIQPIGAQVLDVTVASGNVTNIEMLTGGNGYTDAPSVYIVDDRKDPYGDPIGGIGATAAATIFNGQITDINITNFGTGYSETEPPKIYIAEPKSARASVAVGFNELTGYEIIERGSGYSPSAFLGCSRGVSGAVGYDNLHNEIYAGEAALRQSTHPAASTVINLDSLFIREVFDKFRRQYLPTIEIDYSSINPVQVIKSITDFYISKGTELSTQYLFKIMFGEQVEIYYPRDEIIAPSAATWVVDTVLRAELISGDPVNLIDSQLIQYTDPVDLNVKAAEALIENVITIIEGKDTIYELAISEETLSGSFIIPYKTTLVEPLTTDGQIITVDSTIGWPERNGTIRINDVETAQYKEKSLNQFIECTRSQNGVVEDWDPGTIVYSDIFVYVNQGTSNECKLRVLGIAEAGTTILEDTGSYYLQGDKLKVAKLGSSAEDERLSSWLYNVKKLIQVNTVTPGGVNNQTATVVCDNPHGLLVSDQVTIYGANPVVFNGTFTVTSRIDTLQFTYQINTPTEIIPEGNILLSVDLNRGKSDVNSINSVVSEFTTNIQNSFFNDEYVYVASSGLPNYKVGPFTGSALIPGNQRKLLRFPRLVQTISERQDISANTSIGAWVNGVSIWAYKSGDFVRFGPLTGITVTNTGQDYDAGNKPALEITGGGGTGATGEVVVNGSLTSFDVTEQGSGYLESPLVSIVGGGGIGATAQAIVTGGRVTRILVEQPGTGYTSQPSVSVTGGGGSGALAKANVRGPIQSVSITANGSGYTDLPDIRVNSGEGALAQPIVINGRIVSIAIINSGSGYTTAPTIIINGDGFGAIARAVIGTIGEDKGRVLSVEITNRGIGYTQGLTTVRLESVGDFAEFTPQVFEWNKNLQYDLANNYDGARGYVFTGRNNQFGGEYAHLSDPKELRYVVGDNVFLNAVTQQFQEVASNFEHSPILGWAYDGNPIYGPYGYIDPTDQNSGIRRLRTSYKLKDNVVYDLATNPNPARIDGPSLATYPAGSFVADYEYDFQSGDLDNYNGRFCKSPQYPDGTYAYFITIDASEAGIAEFPYILGPQFNSLPDPWNFTQGATQENIPQGVVRYRDPYVNVDIDVDRQPNQEADVLTTEIEGYPLIFEVQDSNNDGIIDANEQQEILEMSEEATLQIYDYFPQVSAESRVDIEVETTTQFEDAQIDGFVIENPGVSYQVNDTIFFDDGDTGGFGASAFIESVKGQVIQSYSKEIIGDRPYGVITTSANHDLRQQDELILNSSPVIDNTNKNFKVKVVSGIERINVSQSGSGYNEDIPPTFELITSAGQDGQLQIVLQNTGQINSVNIINSGNGYDPENPPQIRVSHPQQYKKTRYWLTEYMEATGIVKVNDIKITSQRNTYICGKITETDGDESGFLAKFDDLGQKIWERTLIPINANQKRAEFLKMVINDTPENDLIYVTGQTKNPDNDVYNPDIWLGLYESGFNNANDPDGNLQWQRAIAGISGSTRRDFVTSIALDQEQRIYLCGYTDTNSVDPDDMWIIQCGIEGDLVEKRKVASQDDSEKMHQIMMISDDRFFFIGVNDQNDDLIFGEFFYDGANLEMDWIKQIPTVGGRVVNPTMTMDDYGAIIVAWDIFNSAASKYDKIQVNKFLLSTAQTTWEWSKTVTTSGDFLEMHHAGISYDQWGNYTLVSDVIEAQNQRYSVISYMKYDGTLLYQTKVDDTASIGFQATNHALDNSGDTVLAVNRQQSDQLVSWRMGNSANPVEDTTKQQLGTYNYFSQSDVTHDAAVYKFDGGSLKFNDVAPITIADLGLTPLEWSGRMWMSMNTTAWNTAHEPTLLHFGDATNTNSITATINGDNTDPDYQKVILYLNGTQVASSVAATNWDAFAAAAWVHITVQKRQESLGLYRYEVFVGGNQQISYQSTTDVALDDVVICGPVSAPTVANSFRGNIDDFVLDDAAPYSGTSYTVPTSEIAITTSNSDVALIKFDRAHTQRAAYTLTGLSNYSNIAFTDHTIGMTWTSVSSGAISTWLEGPGGLQILDMSQTFSTLIPGTYTLSSVYDQYASKTSTIPSPRGKRLIISADVIPKFYMRDALYQKIDNVQEFTFTQPLKLTQYSILQQFNNVGTTTAFATITEVPVGSLRSPGIGTTYRVGKIYGTFNNTDRFRTTTLGGDVNQIEGTYFDTNEEESPWVASTAYAQGDRVYNQKRIYEAQGAGTSGTIAPQHNNGVVSDGVINWAFIDDAGKFTVDLTEHPFPRPEFTGLDMPEWLPHRLYAVGQRVWYKLNVYQVAVGGGGVTTPTPPTHTTGDVSDGTVTWSFVETNEAISQYTRLMPYDQGNNYSIQILEVQPGSNFIPNDVVSVNNGNITLAADEKSVEISGFASVSKIRVTARLEKDILLASSVRTDKVYCTSNSPHFYKEGEIIFAEGFSGAQYNGSFFIDDVIGSREFTFGIRDTAVSDPTFVNNGIANVNIYAKHPTLIFTRNHQYNFELSDPSNFGYYLSFSQDNQYKLEYSFNNTVRDGTPGIAGAGSSTPFVKFLVLGDVTNISYYFDPSRTGSNSPVGENSYIDVITTPYQGRFRISEIVSDTEFKFPLNREPERSNAEIGSDDQGNEYSYYSTTSTRAVGPINTIKLVSPGGFYKKLPIISDIASFRQIEKVVVVDGGTEYAPGVYYDVPVAGDGEGGKVTVTVLPDDETGSGAISSVAVADPGKGYTIASVDIDAITGILGPTLSGSGGSVSVNIPSEGTGASVFLTGRNIGKIKRLKNNEFGFGYSHDYTLKPEITFPVNLQLFNTSILSEIKITDPGAGYTSTPAVVIDGGGGQGADAVAVIKNNRLNEIIIKNPGAGYSSEPVVTLKSEFNYVVNLDLNYLQFNFPHGITTGAEIQFRAENVGSTEGILPKPSSAGLTALIAGQVYYAIAGQANSLESDQIRFGLTLQSAQAGDYITFLTQGSGRQVLLTEVFGGKAEAVVATSRFLEGEEVFQGSAVELSSATGKVSTNTGWQIGPKILKIVDYDGDWKVGEKVTGSISKASGVIDNLSIARGVLNIGSLTKTPGKFIDNVGKPSEIVQKIQDSFFYQNFSYVVKSEIPITKWKTQILENNHPAGFQLFGQLQLVGGKDVSGRKVGTEFTKEVNINNYSNVNQITSFGAAQPIYTDYNNTEVLFRKKRLTSSEEILTSIVKKLDDISPQFNGIDKQFPITVEGEQVIVQQNQLLITINGVIQAPGVSYTIVGGQIVFGEPPKPASRVNYRSLSITPTVIYRIELYSGQAGPANFGIFPTLGQQVQGKDSDVIATVIDSGTTHIDVINLVGGTFNLNEEIIRGTLFSGLILSVTAINSDTIFQFGESITNLEGDTAIIEETNIDAQGGVTDSIVVSKTSGTARFETGIFDLRLNEFVYSASSKIAGQITFISPYIDPATSDAVDELIINPGSTFYGLLFERLVSITNPNVIIDNISQSSITPTELYDSASRINADFLDFEEVRNTEVEYTQLTGGAFSEGDIVINNRANYGNPTSVFHGVATNRFKDASAMILGNKDQIVDFAEAEIAVKHPRFYFPGDIITNSWSRYSDAYRLIQKNKSYIANKAYDEMMTQYTSLTVPDPNKCIRDLELYIDAISIDIFRGGNVYTRKLCQKYFDVSGNFVYVNNESAETRYGFEKAKDMMKLAIVNQLTASFTAPAGQPNAGITYVPWSEVDHGGYDGNGITADPSPNDPYGTNGANQSNNGTDNCTDVQAAITTLYDVVDETLLNGTLVDLPDESLGTYSPGQIKCRRDIGLMIDALAEDVSQGGNYNIIEFTKKYFDAAGAPIANGLIGEYAESLTAIDKAMHLSFQAINNLLYYQVNSRTSVTGFMLKDPTTYQGSYSGGEDDLQEFDVSDAVYTPANGQMVLTIGTHTLTTSDTVTVRPHSLVFTCDADNDASFHAYPRAGDPAFNTPLAISAETGTTITVNVGASPLVQYTPTAATYNPATGDMELTIGSHSLEINDYVNITNDSLVFTCDMDANASTHTYPRSTDPAAGRRLFIHGATATTITVNVAASPADQQYAHTFVSASANSVSSGGGYTHAFVKALDNAVFTGGGTTAEYFDPNYYSGRNETIQNCANVQAYIATLVDISTTAIAAQNLNNINALASITDGTFVAGENIRTTKIAYKDRAGGLFIVGDNITGVTSGAQFEAIGSNSGLKWIFADSVTGSFQDGEYVTNSTTANQNGVSLSVIEKYKRLSGTKSIKFPATGYLVTKDSYDFSFGNTADFTVQGWVRADNLSTTQHLFDFRRLSASSGLRITLQTSGAITVYNGTSQLLTGGTLLANNWHHIAVVRTTSVLQLYVDGVQVGGNYADTNDYGYAAIYIGADFNGANQFTGYMDNVVVKNGESDFNTGFVPPSQINYANQYVMFGLDGEQPFVMDNQETYAIYTGQRISSAAVKELNYDQNFAIIENVDLGRSDHRNCADIIDLNAAWIAEEAVGRMQAAFPDFTIPGNNMAEGSYGGTNVCIRDTKDYIIGALVKDLRDGGNYNSLYTARTYLEASGKLKHVGGEILQTLYAWDQAFVLCKYVITTTDTDLTGTYTNRLRLPNNFSSPASQSIQDEFDQLGREVLEVLAPNPDIFRDSGVLIWKNRDYIAEEVAGYILDKYEVEINGTDTQFLVMPGYGQPYCERDVKQFILPAVIADLCTGGTYNVEAVIDKYLDDQDNILHVEHELNPMLDAFEHAKYLTQKAANNLLLSPGEVSGDFGIPAWTQDDYHAPVFTARASFRDVTITIDDEGYPQDNVSNWNRYKDATNALKTNMDLIAHEAVETMNDMSKFAAFQIKGGPVNCTDDVKDILNAMVHDLNYNCNEKTWDAASLYVETENNSLKHIEDDWEATVTVMKLVRDIATVTIRNGFGRDYIPGNDPANIDASSYESNPRAQIFADCADAIDANIRWISEQAVKAGTTQYSALNINGGSSAMWWKEFTPTTATYSAAAGVLTLTIPNHGLNIGEQISIAGMGITFTCSQDSNASLHPYPRNTDPVYEKRIVIVDATVDTISVNVGKSPAGQQYTHTFVSAVTGAIRYGWSDGGEHFAPTAAAYNASSGDMVLTIPNHSFNVGNRMSIATDSLVFTCSQDANGSEHSYPRKGDPAYGTTVAITAIGTTTKTVGSAAYDAVSGLMTINTVGAHGLSTGNRIKIATDSLTFTCTKDGNATNHAYPRSTDPAADKWLIVSVVDSDTFTCYVGVAANADQYTHAFVSAAAGAVIKQDSQVTVNVGASPAGQQYTHTFVRSTPDSLTSAGSIDCVHDVTDILRALVFNLKYGGDNWINWVSEFYTTYSGSLAHVTSLATEVNWILTETKRLVKRAIRGQIISNVASYGGSLEADGSQSFSEAVPKPTTVLRNSTSDLGIDIGSGYNNLVTRTFTNGTIDILNQANSATGMTRDEDMVCSCVTVLPTGTPADGVLWEGGGSGRGSHLGIRDSGTYLRLRAGNGSNSYAGGASTAADAGLALLDVQISTLSDYFDGAQHEITWEIRIGGTAAAGSGRVKLWIDGNLIGESSTPGLNVGLGEAAGQWSGGDVGGFAASSGSSVPVGESTTAWAYTTSDLTYYRSRLVDPDYTGSESDDVATEIDTLMALVTDAISNPATVMSRTSTLPMIWPIKYTPEIGVRDMGLTYDQSASEWNETCAEVASAIDTLIEIYIDTIEQAANSNVNRLDSIVRTTRLDAYTNTQYQAGTCEGPQSAIDTLFGIMSDTLGAGFNTDRVIANMLLFNKDAIAQRAYDVTVAYYGTTEMTVDFCADIVKAVRYDMITGGNAGAFRLVQNWFDGEGNFIAFQDVSRTHLIYANTRVREYIKSVLYQLTEDPGWATYDTYEMGILGRLDYNREASEFIIDSSLNSIEYSLETSNFPTEGTVTWVPSSDAVNISNKYELGYDYNTDPALVTLTPIVPVGFDRAEYRVRINRTNSFRRGDILQYIPASETSVAAFTTQTYWYVMTATPQWFEVGAHYMHDGRFRKVEVDTNNTGQQIFSIVRRTGIARQTPLFPADPSQTPIQGGFNPADVIYGTTSESSSEVGSISLNQAEINRLYTRFELNNVSTNLGVYENFINGEVIRVNGNPVINGQCIQTGKTNSDGTNFLNLISVAGVINVGDTLVGDDSGTTADVVSFDSRMLINVERGSFAQGDWLFDKASAVEAYANGYLNKSGSLTGNDGGRITIDVETIGDAWDAGDIIYGSVTDYILEIKGLSGTQIQLNQYIHGTNIYQLELGTAIIDTGVSDTFRVGDEIVLLQGTTLKDPGFRATVTEYINGVNVDPSDPIYGIHRLFIGNLIPVGTGTDISDVTTGANNIGKLDLGSNFPSIYANVVSYTDTAYNSYGRVAAIDQQGITATVWLENVKGDFLNNMTLISDYGWGGVVSKARTLEGRVDRYFRGFDGSQTQFDLTISNGEAYFPDPAGHMLIFVNGILQPPGGNNSYVAFSDKINFSEAPDIGSEFVGYYVGKLRQMDDISFEFDSLRSSFNLRREGLFYSLTLTEGVSSNVIRPENNIIVSLNGIIQEPGVAYEIVGSRIIFAEVPRAGSTFVGFSYIGSDTDVIAATVVPPVEAGDKLEIDGEEFARDVALIESSNSLITFEYTGSVKGRNAAALATIRSGQLNTALLTNSGDGYTSRPNVDVISSSGFDGRIKALMGITRIDVKTPGVSYLQPLVEIDNIVPDDFVNPSGTPVNGGRDIYNADEAIDGDTTTITPGAIAINQDPVNVTVNQGQTASFTVAATVTNSQQLNYQWQKKEYGTQTWTNIIGANQSTYNTNNAAQADDGDEYRVAITAAGATPVYSLSAILTVQTGATVISNFTPDQIFDDI